MSRRLDLDPQPNEATETGAERTGKIEQGWGASQVGFARFSQSVTVRVPAAGRLGVQEIQCRERPEAFQHMEGDHERFSVRVAGAPCRSCGAQV